MHETLPRLLADALADAPPGPLRVAFSGGPDSCALLHALGGLPQARRRDLRALHVDHGLHADSARWAAHCLHLCAQWQVPIELLRVQVRSDGQGLEAAARAARYAALAARLPDGALLATAQHLADQAETVLLKLLRGAGPHGLGGMRALRPLRPGWLWRPLLEQPREILQAYLHAQHIEAIEDPANRDPALARSFLRRQALPLLRQRWPHAEQALLHVARVQQGLADDLDRRAAAALPVLADDHGGTLRIRAWLQLPAALRVPVLEHWLRRQHLPVPATAPLQALLRMLAVAERDRVPQLRYGRSVLRAWRDRLYADHWTEPPPPQWSMPWDGRGLDLPGAGGLMLERADARCDPPLRLRRAWPGERLRRAGEAHSRSLGALFQQAQVPPWQRAGCPVIEDADGGVLALGDIAQTAAGQAYFGRLQTRPVWRRGGPRAD